MHAPPASATAAAPAPLSSEQMQALSKARVQVKKVRRAARVASVSGWSLAIFGALTVPFVLFGSLSSLVVGLILGAFAYNELRGGAMIGALDPRGARRLGFNQLGLAVAIVIYSGWSIYAASQTSPLDAYGGSTGDADMDAMVTDLAVLVTYVMYIALAVGGGLGCGLTALYYFSRERLIRDFVTSTPPWVTDVLRTAG